uniref:NADH dehydrogenase subunit 6 n=1 Tax=Ixodes kohlsi TaxID=2995590 RepID=UPI00286BFA6F|nr:NADH dehydrogenase subunit 6 [Ixodes kohlsi]WKW95300.1 NADH dehydrogenase subunit 6 [Ixodes kohlsi]WKW95313.1 NADH dehydrogenase subunit 6 [Ixodes kohlsi]
MNFLTLFSVTFFMFNHPMFMLMSIIVVTLLLSFSIMKYMKMMWISLILILLVLGGMLILFLYMISLIPNKKLNINKKNIFFIILIFLSLKMNFKMDLTFLFMNSLFFQSSMNMIIFMMTYLLITLMVIMKIMISSNSPLKLNN